MSYVVGLIERYIIADFSPALELRDAVVRAWGLSTHFK